MSEEKSQNIELLKEISHKLDQFELLKEVLKWIKFERRKKAIELFRSELDTDEKKLIYELSDGKSSPEIAEIMKMDSSTIRYYWHKWAEAGMMEICSDYKRRYCTILSLRELGIEIPDIESVVSQKIEEGEK